MLKGESVFLKGKIPVIYKGKTSQGSNAKHLVQLPSGEHKEVFGNELSTAEEIESLKNSKKRASQSAKSTLKIDQLKQELSNLQRELKTIEQEQEAHAGQFVSTDDFEAAGLHDEYGTRMEQVQNRIDRIVKQIKSYSPNENLTDAVTLEEKKKSHKHRHKRNKTSEHIGPRYHTTYGYIGGWGGYNYGSDGVNYTDSEDYSDSGGDVSGGLSESIKLLERLTDTKIELE